MYVIKRDGSIEQFEVAKIVKVMLATGIDEQKALVLAKKVEEDLSDSQKVTSLQIRDKVLEVLKAENQYSADLFQWYQKTKEN